MLKMGVLSIVEDIPLQVSRGLRGIVFLHVEKQSSYCLKQCISTLKSFGGA